MNNTVLRFQVKCINIIKSIVTADKDFILIKKTKVHGRID